MKVIVDVSDNLIELINNFQENGIKLNTYEKIISDGIKLPKGYGKIVDVDAIFKLIEEDFEDCRETQIVKSLFDYACSRYTILEADKNK